MRNQLIVGALGLLIISAEVRAQEGLRDRDRNLSASQGISSDLRRARFRSGPFYLLSSVQLSDIGYNSEFFVPTGETGSGLSFGLSAPNRLYYVPTRKTVFSLEATPEYTLFSRKRQNGSHGQFGYLTRADAQFLLNHVYLDFFASRSDALVPFSGEINRLATRRLDTVGLSSELKYSSKTSMKFQADTRGTQFPESRYQPSDTNVSLLTRTEQNYRLSFLHKTFPLTTLHLAGERSNYAFSQMPLSNSHRTFVAAGLTFDNGRNSFTAEAGPGKLDFKDRSQKSFSGALGNLQYARRGGAWTFTALANRDVDFSIFQDNRYYVFDRGSALLEYAVTRRLKLRFSDTAGVDRYDIPSRDTTGFFLRRRDTMNFAAVGWLYTLHRLTGGFDIGYYKRTSNFDVETQDGIRGIIHLSFTP